MRLATSRLKEYGSLVTGDVFIRDSMAWQKLKNGRSYCHALNVEIVVKINEKVDYVGLDVWPSEE